MVLSVLGDVCRETLLSMVFYKWWRESQLSQDVRMLERVVSEVGGGGK